MEKFFVTDFAWEETSCEAGGKVFGLCFPEDAEVLSFCKKENAEVLARKVRERREEISLDTVMYHSSNIYAVNVPDNWNGGDIAQWLFGAIERKEIVPVC